LESLACFLVTSYDQDQNVAWEMHVSEKEVFLVFSSCEVLGLGLDLEFQAFQGCQAFQAYLEGGV